MNTYGKARLLNRRPTYVEQFLLGQEGIQKLFGQPQTAEGLLRRAAPHRILVLDAQHLVITDPVERIKIPRPIDRAETGQAVEL